MDSSDSDPLRPQFPRWDRQFWLCLLIALCVLVPRGALIMRQHSDPTDSMRHLRHGLAFMLGYREQIAIHVNDPPGGQMLLVLPMVLTGCTPDRPICDWSWPAGEMKPGERPPGEPPPTEERARYERRIRRDVLFGNRLRPETILMLIAIWKSMLFVPCIGVIFQWVRTVFGNRAGWLSAALVLVDPTFAAHIPIAAVDSLAVEGIVISCYLMWRYFEDERTWRLAAVAAAVAAAVLMKHTAVFLPCVFGAYAASYWLWRPWREGTLSAQWREKFVARRTGLATALLVGFATLWTLLLFDVSRPIDQVWEMFPTRQAGGELNWLHRILQQRMPAGAYVGCFFSGYFTNKNAPQTAYLWGNISGDGFWYYFPALMSYKVPLGIAGVLLLAIASLARRRRAWPGEESILVPLVVFTAFLLSARMNYSFRHFMPAYVFMLMWAGRSVAGAGRVWVIAAWIGIAVAAAHTIWRHPNYLSYINCPRRQIHLQITDSNLDWGQALRQVPDWVQRHAPGRKVYVIQDTGLRGINGAYWLGKYEPQIEFLIRRKPYPNSGLLVINPAYVCGAYDEPGKNYYQELTRLEPVGWVGDAMPVFDLEHLSRK